MKNLLLIIFTFFNTLIYCQTNINTNDKLIPFAESNSFNEIKYGYRNLKNYIIVKPIFDFAENMIQNYSIVGLYIDDSIRYAILDVNGVCYFYCIPQRFTVAWLNFISYFIFCILG